MNLYYLNEPKKQTVHKSIRHLFAKRQHHRYLSVKQWITHSFYCALIEEKIPLCCIINYIFDDIIFGIYSGFIRGWIRKDSPYTPCWFHYFVHRKDVRKYWKSIPIDYSSEGILLDERKMKRH